jgi:hypothetical protein
LRFQKHSIAVNQNNYSDSFGKVIFVSDGVPFRQIVCHLK